MKPQPIGGPLITRYTIVLALTAAIGLSIIVWRFAAGLGATTGLSDGYPWGIWIAYDVVTGTALACGGYSVAILVYIFNQGRYHPLVRPAVLTSALGYTLAGLSVAVDIGRPWNAWKLLEVWGWNRSSILLEVALCILTYTVVLWIELSPAFLEKARDDKWPWFDKLHGAQLLAFLNRALPFILAAGLLLPTMHQSSLGSLLMVASHKVHPLWHTPMMPLLFLISVVGMGYAAVVFENAVCSLALNRRSDTKMLSTIGGILPYLVGAFLLVRFTDLALRGRLGLIFTSGFLSGFFLLEQLLLIGGAVTLLPARKKVLPMSTQFRAAVLLILGGALYRFDVFLVAFNPGTGWHYFPSVPETLVSVGIVALEVLGYILIVKRFPILSGQTAPRGAQ